MSWLGIATAAAALAVSWLTTGAIARWLHRRAIVDQPNPRSSHTTPTPRGGGLAVVATVAAAWLVLWAWDGAPRVVPAMVVWAGLLAALSWLDDMRGLPVMVRLLAHAVAVAGGLATLPEGGLVFQGLLSPSFDLAATGLLWLWFVNLYNFMDGIDGIAAAETAAIGGGVAVIALVTGLGDESASLALTSATAALGFLYWNWQPARIFLGDVGSIPLGFLLGWLLLGAAIEGAWAAALLLPLYFLADATITLGFRVAKGERIWRAHANHFYQRAARALGSHAPVVRAVILVDVGLIAAAVLTAAVAQALWPGILLGVALCAILLWYLGCAHPRAPTPQSYDES